MIWCHYLLAQMRRQFLKSRLRVLIGLIPDGRFHERKARGDRRLRGGDFPQSRGRAMPHIRIARVKDHQLIAQEGEVLDRASEKTHVVDRPRLRKHSVA